MTAFPDTRSGEVFFDFMEYIKQIPPISVQAAEAYARALPAMVEYVNNQLESRKDINAVLGGNSVGVMRLNHRNHAVFMAGVFRINNFSLMGRVVIWAYRAYIKHGFKPEYFVMEISAWMGAIHQSVEPSLQPELLRVYRMLATAHQDLLVLAETVVFPAPEVPKIWQERQQKFLQGLLQGKADLLAEDMEDLCVSADHLASFYDHVIFPSMFFIGQMWEDGTITVAREHLASNIVTRLISHFYLSFQGQKKFRGRAVLAACQNEMHEIGAMAIAQVLEMDGWQVDYLGADMPNLDMIKHVIEIKPDLLAISLALPFNIENTEELIRDMRREMPDNHVPFTLIGGGLLRQLPDLANLVGADRQAPDARGALEVTRHICRVS